MNRHLLIFLDKTLFQLLFSLVALFAKGGAEKAPSLKPKDCVGKHFLVIRPGGIGDGLMSLPLLKNIQQHFSETRVTLICLKKNKLAYKHVSCFDDLIVLNTKAGLFQLLRLFSKCSVDVVFDLEPFRKVSALISYFSRAAVRVGFDTNDRRVLYTHLIGYPNEKYYESYNMIRQLQAVGLTLPESAAEDLSFVLPEQLRESAKALLREKGLVPEQNFIVALAPGVLKKHHRWRMPYFAELIQQIQKEDARVKVLLLGAPADKTQSQAVLSLLAEGEKPLDLVGKTSYSESLAILSFCDLLITCDGGMVYMGAAMGCSTLSIWGPGVMERFKPRGEHHPGIRLEYPCVPCVNYSRLGEFPDCPYDRKCINDISPEMVFTDYKHLKKLREKGPLPLQVTRV